MSEDNRFKFDENRTFGVEFECVIKDGNSRALVLDALLRAGIRVIDTNSFQRTVNPGDSWIMKTDASVQTTPGKGGHPMEIVTPILKGFRGLDEVRKAAKVLRGLCYVNKSCGLHVHHGASDLDDAEFRALHMFWRLHQSVIDKMVPPSRRGAHYADHLLATPPMGATNVCQIVARRESRYRAVNFASYAIRGTVEFRQHNGTLEYKKVWAWIMFTQACLAWARRNKTKERTRGLQNNQNPRHYLFRERLRMVGKEGSLEQWARRFLEGRMVKFDPSCAAEVVARVAGRVSEEEARAVVAGAIIQDTDQDQEVEE